MTYHGKKYTNTQMCVWLVNRYGKKSEYWHRVFIDEDGTQRIKFDDRMAALSEFRVHSIGTL